MWGVRIAQEGSRHWIIRQGLGPTQGPVISEEHERGIRIEQTFGYVIVGRNRGPDDPAIIAPAEMSWSGAVRAPYPSLEQTYELATLGDIASRIIAEKGSRSTYSPTALFARPRNYGVDSMKPIAERHGIEDYELLALEGLFLYSFEQDTSRIQTRSEGMKPFYGYIDGLWAR